MLQLIKIVCMHACMLQLIRIDYCENILCYTNVYFTSSIAININAYPSVHVVSIAYSTPMEICQKFNIPCIEERMHASKGYRHCYASI